MSILDELRRRNVWRMAALYLVVAWLTMQVAEVLISLAAWPEWIGQATLGVLAIGFPIALILSWFYELTPEGVSREQDVDPGVSVPHAAGRRFDFIVIALLCAAVALFAYDKWWMRGPLERSIAVLPFENMSPEKDSAGFLAMGIQDDLLTKLSKIGTLRVISRTSVGRYRNTAKSIRQIGEELGVSKILEGGVRRIGDQIRVNVQLIDVATDDHLWAETYDRRLGATNVFEMQSEIAGTIVEQLDATLTPSESRQLAAMPTENFAAYTAYLRARNKADIGSIESLNSAIKGFEEALSLDPDFALAYVGLADAYLTLSANFLGGLSTDESIALAEPPLKKALALDSSLGQAYAAVGLLREQQGMLEAAEEAYEKAISLQPNYSRVFLLYGRMRWDQNRREEALALLQKALALDPYSAPVNFAIARAHDESGEFDEALARYLRVVEIEPDHAFAYVYIAAIHYLVHGRADESLIWYYKAAKNDALSPSLQAVPALPYLELGDAESARQWIDRGLDLGPDTFWSVWASLLLHVYVGDDVAAQRDARTLLETYPRNWGALNLLRNADLAAGRYAAARSRYARAYRELTEPEVPEVDASNYFAAVDLALVLVHLGERERANDLLAGSQKVIEALPRLGINGYWINDAQIFSLQGRPQRALAALGQAIDEGWINFSWYYLEHNPNFDSIRTEPEFQRLREALQQELARQATRVEELKESGELPLSR